MLKERKLVLVFWEDITTTDTTWREEEEALTWVDDTDSIVRQVGFLVSKDQDYISLCCSYIPGQDLIGSVIRIPMSTVKYVQEISIDDLKRVAADDLKNLKQNN